jgi:hypothetical protein
MGSCASAYIIGYAESKRGESRDVRGCATFVSDAFTVGCGTAGVSKPFSASSNVAGIVGQFPPSAISSDVGSALPADLIVFGDDEHVMIYTGNGNVVGTLGGEGTTTVQDKALAAVVTKRHPTVPVPVKVIHTGMASTDVIGGLVGAGWDLSPIGVATDPGQAVADVQAAIGAVFGDFKWVPIFAINAGILVGAGALIYVGLKQTVSGAEETV